MTALRRLLPCVGLALAMTAAPSSAQLVQEYVTGLLSPIRTLALEDGSLLVAESGLTNVNTGRVSLVDRDGRRFTVIDQLPSGFHGPTNDPTGPTAVLLFGHRLYILIGNGDISINAAGGIERVNPSPSSPLFSSLLLLELPPFAVDVPTGFQLPRSAHETIASGNGVYLTNADGQSARLSRLVDFVDYVPMPRPDAPDNVQISNPFSMVGSDARFHVVDAARNLLWTVGLVDTTPAVVTTFPPVTNTVPGNGPPMVDAVPASVRTWRDDLIVSFLTGFPFGPGAARVARVDRRTGETTTLIPGLQTALDVLPVSRGRGQFYVVEYSGNFLAGAPGRLLLVEDPDRAPLEIASGLLRPTSISENRRGDLFITEIGAGRIVRIAAPQ